MGNSLNAAGKAHASSLVSAGKVNHDGAWSFSAADGNKLLGPNGDDWTTYGSWHLGVDASAAADTKAHWKYPFGKDGVVFRHALIAAKGRAAQQGDTAIENACTTLLDKIDPPKTEAPEGVRKIAGIQQRAWATLEIKSFDDTTREFEGIASTPTPDRMDDVVEPMGARYSLPMPLLWMHDSSQPVGHVISAKPTSKGIPIRGKISQVDGPPSLKEALDCAWAMIKPQGNSPPLVRGLSIGFVPDEYEAIKDSMGYRYKTWDWMELSCVTIPANMEASITTVKSADQQQRAASGHSTLLSLATKTKPTPGATGKAVSLVTNQGAKVKTFTEQIKDFEGTRQAKQARVDALMEKSSEEGRTFDAAEAEEYDGLKAELKAIDEHLVRLHDQEKNASRNLKSVSGTTDADDGGTGSGDKDKRTPVITGMKSNLPPGMGLARYVKALAYAKGNNAEAQQYAAQWKDTSPEVLLALKSAIAAGTVADSTWAGPLVYNQNMASEFLNFLRPQTIIGKLTGLRMVPFNIRYATQTSGSTVGWVGEGLGKPVSKLALGSATLGFAKAAGIVIITQELARYSSPAAELLVRDDLAAQMIQFLDQQFVDPSVVAVSNVNPASVTNGSSNVLQATGIWNTQANVLTDIKAFLQKFADNNIMLDSSAVWIMTPSAALALSMIVTVNGVQAFPDITLDGGTLFGVRVITSNSVPASVSAGSIVVLAKASEIQMADDGAIAIDVSQEASLLMDSVPSTQTAASPTGSSVVSMFQTNSLAIRVERVINWARRRSYAVGYIDNMHTA